MLMLLISQSSPVWMVITGEGAGVGIFIDGVIFVTWLAIMLWPFSFRALLLYMCNLEMWLGPSSYWYVALVVPVVSSIIICGDFCSGFLVARPGLINMISSYLAL